MNIWTNPSDILTNQDHPPKPNRHTKIVETIKPVWKPIILINPYPSLILATSQKTTWRKQTGTVYLKELILPKTVTFLLTTLSPLSLCLPPLLILPSSVLYQKRSQRQLPTMTPFNIP